MYRGNKIRAVRKQRGLTLKNVAATTGLSIQRIYEVELGLVKPPPVNLTKIARALGVDARDLLEEDDKVTAMTVNGDTEIPTADGQTIRQLAERLAAYITSPFEEVREKDVEWAEKLFVAVYAAGYQKGQRDRTDDIAGSANSKTNEKGCINE